MLYQVIDSSLFINGKVVHIGETVELPETFAESIIRFLKPINNDNRNSTISFNNDSRSVNKKTKKIKDK